MPPRWLPDWQNKAQYPNPAQAFRVDWAWEFLRRNPDYQRLWSQLIKPSYKRAHVKFSWRHVAPPAQLVSNRIRPFLHSTAGNYPLAIFRAQFGIVTVPPNPSEPKPKLRTFSYHSCQRRERATSIKGAGMSGTTFWRGLTVSAKDAGHLHPSCAPMARRTLSRTICGALVMVAPTTLHM